MVGRTLLLAMVLGLTGCSGGSNSSISTLQFTGAEEPFPADYAARAARYLGEERTPGVLVSYPRSVVGETAVSPRRWYVCLSGVQPPGPPPSRAKPVLEAAFDLFRPGAARGVYNVIVFLRASGTASALRGFDSPLCADGRYEALPAA